MKKTIFCTSIVSLLFFLQQSKAQNIGINGVGTAAHPSALLDIDAVATPSLGVLIPRIALQAINMAAPVTSPATSLLVYNTASASTGTNAVSAGYYYWDGTKWVRFAYSASGSSSTAWDLLGNTGTNPTTHFLGTTDAQDLVFRTNNLEAVRVSTIGNVGIGIATPSSKLHINAGNGATGTFGLIVNSSDVAGGALPLIINTNSTGQTFGVNTEGRHLRLLESSGVPHFYDLGINGAQDFFISNQSDFRAFVIENITSNVGIGTNNPQAKLHVNNTSTVTSSPIFRLGRVGAVGFTNFHSGATIGDWSGLVSTGDKSIIFTNDLDPTADATTGLVIAPWSGVGNSNPNKGLKIMENGNVGIGTANPSGRLDIDVTDIEPHNLVIYDPVIGSNIINSPITRMASKWYGNEMASIDFWRKGAPNDGQAISFNTSESNTVTPVSRLYIEHNGNIGIGTTSPSLKLHLHDAAQNFHALRFTSGSGQTDYWDLVKRGEAYGGGQDHNFIISHNAAERLTITPTGEVGIGAATPASRFDVMGAKPTAAVGTGVSNNAASQVIITNGSTGVLYQNDWPVGWGGGLATWDICGQGTFFSFYTTRSDSRLKKDITDMNQSIEKNFMKLRPVTYLLKKETPEINGTQYGFIAQEVAELFPTLVTKDTGAEGATIGMNYQGLIAPTIHVVQEQQKQIETQNKAIEELKKQNSEFVKRIEVLEKK